MQHLGCRVHKYATLDLGSTILCLSLLIRTCIGHTKAEEVVFFFFFENNNIISLLV